MDKKMKYVCLAMAMILGNVAIAQNTNQDKTDLNKSVTLEREFDPVKKVVVKKTVLPKEVKKVEKDAVAPQFSDWAVPTLVPVEIPTMEPYGYRTRPTSADISSWEVAPTSISWREQDTVPLTKLMRNLACGCSTTAHGWERTPLSSYISRPTGRNNVSTTI